MNGNPITRNILKYCKIFLHFINNITTLPDMFSDKLFSCHHQRTGQEYQERDSVV